MKYRAFNIKAFLAPTRGERGNMKNNTMMEAIKYVQESNLLEEANLLANKVGDIYMACVIIFKNIPQTKENLEMCKKIVKQKKEADKKAFYDFINGVCKDEI